MRHSLWSGRGQLGGWGYLGRRVRGVAKLLLRCSLCHSPCMPWEHVSQNNNNSVTQGRPNCKNTQHLNKGVPHPQLTACYGRCAADRVRRGSFRSGSKRGRVYDTNILLGSTPLHTGTRAFPPPPILAGCSGMWWHRRQPCRK